MIAIFTGLPGSGKSYKMAQTIVDTLYRNLHWFEKSGTIRPLYSNLAIEPHALSLIFEDYPNAKIEDFIKYWSDPSQLVALRDTDVFWDEIATHLDATQWQNMPLELKRWLQQHRKFGIEIYGTTQDFAQIDKSMRRLTSDLVQLHKLVGSRDPSPTRPPVRYIWGLILAMPLDPQTYDEENSKHWQGMPSLYFLTRKYVEVFSTRQEIAMGRYPPLRHIERHCLTCNALKTVHA